MDAEDRKRTLNNKEKLLLALQYRRRLTNEEARRIAGSRALARCHELIKEGHPIRVKKLRGAIWQITYGDELIRRDPVTPNPHPRLF